MSVTATQRLGSVRFWDVTLGPKCSSPDRQPAGPEIGFAAGEHHRVYAIPIVLPGSDGPTTLIALTWGTGYEGEGDQALQRVNPFANTLLQSIQASGH